MPRACVGRGCAAVAALLGLALGAAWWMLRSPLEFVAPLPKSGQSPMARGNWLVQHDGWSPTGPPTTVPVTITTVSSLGGGPKRRLAQPPGVQVSAAKVTTGNEVVYYTFRPGATPTTPVQGLYRIPLDGSPGAAVASNLDLVMSPQYCTVVGGNLYWIAHWLAPRIPRGRFTRVIGIALYTIPLQGGTVRRLCQDRFYWIELAASDTGLVWAEMERGGRTLALHHYRPADGRHTVWRGLPLDAIRQGFTEVGGRYYGRESLLPKAQRGTPGIYSFTLDGTDCRRVWTAPRQMGRRPAVQQPWQIMQHRGQVVALVPTTGRGRMSVCEFTPNATGATMRVVCALPDSCRCQAYCDSGYCYLEARPTRSALAGWPDWVARLLYGTPRAGVYRVRL